MRRRLVLRILGFVVLSLCAALLAVLRISAVTLRDARIEGAEHSERLSTVSIEWSDPRPFDSPGISALFVAQAGVGDAIESAYGSTSIELAARLLNSEGKARVALVEGDLFGTLGVPVLRGSSQLGSREAVISHRYWMRAFNGRPDVLGAQLQVWGRSMQDDPWTTLTVIGVASEKFAGIRSDLPEDVWISWRGWPNILLPDMESEQFVARAMPLDMIIRTNGRHDSGALAAELTKRALDAGLFKAAEARIVVIPGANSNLATWTAFDNRSRIFSLLSALLIVVTVSSILSTQALQLSSNAREDAVRHALGEGSTQRFARFSRSAILSNIPPTIAGAALAAMLFKLLSATNDDRLAWLLGRFDWHRALPVLLETSALVAAISTALTLAAMYVVRAVAGSGYGSAVSRGTTPRIMLTPLAAGVVGVMAVMVLAAGVLAQLRDMQSRPFGFDPATVSVASMVPRTGDSKQAFIRLLTTRPLTQLLAELNSFPSGSVALASSAPFGIPLVRELRTQEDPVQVFVNEVTLSYFQLFQIPTISGRLFDAHAPSEVVVTPKFAQRFLDPGPPIGQRLSITKLGGGLEQLTVVGVTADIHRISAKEETTGVIYRTLSTEGGFWAALASAEQSSKLELRLAQYLRSSAQDADWMLTTFERLSQRVNWAYRVEWLEARFLAFVAVALVFIGLYAALTLIRSLIMERAQEMAVRRFLGAQKRSLILSAIGVAPWFLAGFVAVAALGVYLLARSSLPELSPSNVSSATVFALLVMLVGSACVVLLSLNSRMEQRLLQVLKEAGF